MDARKLSDISPGECCVITNMNISGRQRRRILELGFQPQSKLLCAFIAPSGSPLAFWVKNALVALRREDCANIEVICHE